MGTSYYVLHTPAEANYSAYTYYQIYVNAGGTLTYKGSVLPSPSGGPIVLDLTVNSPTDATGTLISFLGKKKPEAFAPGPPGQGGVNTDGTWSIK
jgi:hypothetical protein